MSEIESNHCAQAMALQQEDFDHSVSYIPEYYSLSEEQRDGLNYDQESLYLTPGEYGISAKAII